MRYADHASPRPYCLTLRLVAAALLCSMMAAAASGAILYWDTNGTTAGAGTANGTWSTGGGAANRRWNTSSAGTSATASYTSGSDVVFSAGTDDTGSYTVTLAAIQNVSSITVEEGSPTLNSFAVNFNDASPDVLVATGSTLTFGVAPTSTSNGLNLGSATATGTTVFSANTSLTGTVNLAGGTLRLASTSYTFGTLNVTGNSTIDFAGATTLNLTTLTISAGVTLTIQNWTRASDFFFTNNWSGVTKDVLNNGGATPVSQVVFTGFTANQTGWDSFDNQIRPNVPEARTYGAILLGALSAVFAWRRLMRRPAC